jgi:predicted HicB family RNase H-like nuclease
MDITRYVDAIDESLAAAAAIGDEETRRTAAALATALDAGARLAIMSALSEFALEVSTSLPDRVVEARLDGSEISVSVSEMAEPASDEDERPLRDSRDLSRLTLRLPDDLKERAVGAAANEGVSLNSWLARAVQDALRRRTRTPSHARVRGWVQG